MPKSGSINSGTVNMFISIPVFMIQILKQLIFLERLAENTYWEWKENSQVFNEDFYLPLYHPLCSRTTIFNCPIVEIFNMAGS